MLFLLLATHVRKTYSIEQRPIIRFTISTNSIFRFT
jgi:hypothetical protein